MTTVTDRRKADKLQSLCWMARKPGTYPNAEVTFTRAGMVRAMIMESDINAYALYMDRPTARLLATRLNEALDEWPKA